MANKNDFTGTWADDRAQPTPAALDLLSSAHLGEDIQRAVSEISEGMSHAVSFLPDRVPPLRLVPGALELKQRQVKLSQVPANWNSASWSSHRCPRAQAALVLKLWLLLSTETPVL